MTDAAVSGSIRAAPPRRRLSKPALAAAAALAVTLFFSVGVPLLLPAQPATASPASTQPPRERYAGLWLSMDATLPAPRRGAAARRRAADDAAIAASSSAPAGLFGVTAANPDGSADDNGSARGVVRAVREATLSTRMAARIADMPLADGASFKSGDLLVAFDCERQLAEARAAAAAVEVQKKTVETNEELDKFESIGKNDLSISKSQLDKTRAEADALTSQMRDCKLTAPFAGRVIERMAHNHEAVTANQPLLRVVDTSALELELIVPSIWLQWLAEGAAFEFRIDETGQTVAAAVTRLTPVVDPVSKTTKVIAGFRSAKAMARVLPGMSGSARFERTRG